LSSARVIVTIDWPKPAPEGNSEGVGDIEAEFAELSLRELETLTSFRTAGLLALDRTRITREEAEVTKLAAVPFVERDERTSNCETKRTSLSRLPTADDVRANIEATERVGCGERLLNGRHERGAREVVA
jgi:hypothetical protein